MHRGNSKPPLACACKCVAVLGHCMRQTLKAQTHHGRVACSGLPIGAIEWHQMLSGAGIGLAASLLSSRTPWHAAGR